MDSTVDAVRGYYDENAQLEWDRLEKHPFEFIFTTGMMERLSLIHILRRRRGWRCTTT